MLFPIKIKFSSLRYYLGLCNLKKIPTYCCWVGNESTKEIVNDSKSVNLLSWYAKASPNPEPKFIESRWSSNLLIPLGTKERMYSMSFVYNGMLPKFSFTFSRFGENGAVKSSPKNSALKLEWAKDKSRFFKLDIFKALVNYFLAWSFSNVRVQLEWNFTVEASISKA